MRERVRDRVIERVAGRGGNTRRDRGREEEGRCEGVGEVGTQGKKRQREEADTYQENFIRGLERDEFPPSRKTRHWMPSKVGFFCFFLL